ncbi:DUF5681 domain-containing protein [Candidatus Methylospira mobilis]|nr:DUF5681 domain-containing protein [Candidatus Methylospira mobilis]
MAFNKGQSGNPAGRKKGVTFTEKLKTALEPEIDGIISALVTQAKMGDTAAASLLISRVMPTMRPVQEPVKVALKGDTLSDKAECIIDAVASGKLSPMDGKSMLDGLGALAKLKELEALNSRVSALDRMPTRIERVIVDPRMMIDVSDV